MRTKGFGIDCGRIGGQLDLKFGARIPAGFLGMTAPRNCFGANTAQQQHHDFEKNKVHQAIPQRHAIRCVVLLQAVDQRPGHRSTNRCTSSPSPANHRGEERTRNQIERSDRDMGAGEIIQSRYVRHNGITREDGNPIFRKLSPEGKPTCLWFQLLGEKPTFQFTIGPQPRKGQEFEEHAFDSVHGRKKFPVTL